MARMSRCHPHAAALLGIVLLGACTATPPASPIITPNPTASATSPLPTTAATSTPAPSSPAASPLASPTLAPTPTPPPQVGLAWTQVVDPDLASAPYNGGMYGVLAGGPGAIAWGYRYRGPSTAGGLPMARGPEIWTTVDGRDWAPARVEAPTDADPADPGDVLDLVAGGPGFVAIGSYYRAGQGSTVLVWASQDGLTWSRIPEQAVFASSRLGQVVPWKSGLLAFGCELISAVDCGDGRLWVSMDGTAWTKITPSLPEGLFGPGIVDPASDRLWGRGSTSTDGFMDPDAPRPSRIASTDGRTWAAVALPILGIERLHPLSGGLYLTVDAIPSGDPSYAQMPAWISRTPGVYRSTDLATWEPLAVGRQLGFEIIAVGGTQVMVGTTGTGCWIPAQCVAAAWRSTDGGRTWEAPVVTALPTSGMPGAMMRAVAALPDGTLVAVGRLAATDGTPATAAWVSPPQLGR